MKLYGNPMSTCTRKVLFLLAEKNAKFDFEVLDFGKGEHKSPDHVARQPFGQVPALDDDGFELFESRAMLRYLDERLEGPSFTPKDLKKRALMEQWISVETSNFTVPAMKIIYQRIFHPMRGLPVDAAAVEEGRTALGRCLDIMETQLGKTKYVAGDELTLADIGYLPYIEYIFAGGDGDLVTSRPHVSRWWTELSSRPSWQKATGKN